MADAIEEDAPGENVQTLASQKLLDWIKGKVKPNIPVTRSTYSSLKTFKETFPNLLNQYQYDIGPAQLQECFSVVKQQSTFTSQVELEPLEFHLQSSTVYVFNPFFYKLAWKCGDAVGLVHLGFRVWFIWR